MSGRAAIVATDTACCVAVAAVESASDAPAWGAWASAWGLRRRPCRWWTVPLTRTKASDGVPNACPKQTSCEGPSPKGQRPNGGGAHFGPARQQLGPMAGSSPWRPEQFTVWQLTLRQVHALGACAPFRRTGEARAVATQPRVAHCKQTRKALTCRIMSCRCQIWSMRSQVLRSATICGGQY